MKLKRWLVAIKYAISSVVCFLIDNGLFTIINTLLATFSVAGTTRRLIATVGARAVSSLVNYYMNAKIVFASTESAKKTMVRYYILVVIQAAASFLLVNLIAGTIFHMNGGVIETVVKLIVDSLLFIASFQIQKRWVFNKDND